MFVYIPITDYVGLESRGLWLLSKHISKSLTCLPRINLRQMTAESVCTYVLLLTVSDIHRTKDVFNTRFGVNRTHFTVAYVNSD